jgi:A/G-specific adenine glycosylase
LKGEFPNNYEALLQLKGVGPYTAAAIASFAYNLPHAVVDGNVFRVFARYYGIHTPTDTKEGLAIFNQIAFENLAKKKAGIYNQALMDFGATVCKPMSPLCSSCIMKNTCAAFNQNIVGQLPLKIKVIQKTKRYFDYFILRVENQYWLQQRSAGDIWAGLHQFYLVEQEKAVSASEFYFKELLANQLSIDAQSITIQLPNRAYQQQLTHQLLTVRFIQVQLKQIPPTLAKGLWVKESAFKKYAFPKTINSFLEEEGL